jgi:GNAT superfamily N-acetyltransferase
MPETLLATRPAKESDFQYVWGVYREAVKPYIEPKLKDGWIDSVEIERFRKIWKAADSHIIMVDKTPIGWGGAVVSENEIRIDHLYIEPQHRGKGYGTRLVSELTKMWSKEGKTIYAPVLREKRLVALTSRIGFVKHGDDTDSLVQMLVYKKK